MLPGRPLRPLASALVGALLLGACATDGSPEPTPTPRRGGSAVFAARFFTECGLNPITCPAVNSNPHSVLKHVFPRAMEFDPRGNLVASALLTEAPTLENGGLTQAPFAVRFEIRPRAVWDDGSPITSADFDFTWRALKYTTRPAAYEEGYDRILSIDATDPQMAVIELTEPYAQWGGLFGGADGYLLKRSAFPDAHPDRPDLAKEIKSSIQFSGGPFRIEYADVGTVVLVRNDRYFGKRPYLDKVTFVLTPDEEEPEALRLGSIAASIVEPLDDLGMLKSLRHPRLRAIATDSQSFEALWLNQGVPPLDDPKVREALMYAVDRQALLDRLVKPNNPFAEVLNCGAISFPSVGPWCRTRPFEQFTYHPGRARRILESGGYDCSGRFCLKNGRPLEIEYWALGVRQRRVDTQSMVVEHAARAGFALKKRTYEHSPNPPLWEFPIIDSARTAEGDPSVTEWFGCDQIPSAKEFPYSRLNWSRWCNPEADRLMRQSDRELDPQRRLGLMERIYELQALDFVLLPLYVPPVVSAWRTDKIAGPIGRYSSTPYGMFFNMNEWYVPAPTQT